MHKLILATNNQNKLREIAQMLSPLGIRVLSQSEAGISLDVDETGTTFTENARLKAHALHAHLAGQDAAVLADDSGLMVDALDGAPGVYSHRYAGENATDADRCDKLLRELAGVAPQARTARFVCVMVLLMPDGVEYSVTGKVEGVIGDHPAGENGFGYDPVFYCGERSFAEIPAEEKNRISHRADALGQIYEIMKENHYVNK